MGTWLRIDEAARYMGGVSRKTVYAAVHNGMKVARLGDSGRRLLFNTDWIDEFLAARADDPRPTESETPRVDS